MYLHSVWNDYDDCSLSGQTTTNDYNLGRPKSGMFTATIGELDTDPSNITLQWSVALDNQPPRTYQLVKGQSETISIPVANVLTLMLATTQITSLQGTTNPSCTVVDAAWGDAEILP